MSSNRVIKTYTLSPRVVQMLDEVAADLDMPKSRLVEYSLRLLFGGAEGTAWIERQRAMRPSLPGEDN